MTKDTNNYINNTNGNTTTASARRCEYTIDLFEDNNNNNNNIHNKAIIITKRA